MSRIYYSKAQLAFYVWSPNELECGEGGRHLLEALYLEKDDLTFTQEILVRCIEVLPDENSNPKKQILSVQ